MHISDTSPAKSYLHIHTRIHPTKKYNPLQTKSMFRWVPALYLHRWMRITPAYAFAFFLHWKIAPILSYGQCLCVRFMIDKDCMYVCMYEKTCVVHDNDRYIDCIYMYKLDDPSAPTPTPPTKPHTHTHPKKNTPHNQQAPWPPRCGSPTSAPAARSGGRTSSTSTTSTPGWYYESYILVL